MHMWGDESFDWESLGKAINLTTKIMVKLGRIGFHSKEKFGEFRGYTSFYNGGLHSVLYPGYVRSRFPKWLWHLEVYYFPTITKYMGLNWLVWQWQKRVYNWAYQASLKKYPHIAAEIVSAADYPELIDGFYKIEYKDMCAKIDKSHEAAWKETKEIGEVMRSFLATLPTSPEKTTVMEELDPFFGWSSGL